MCPTSDNERNTGLEPQDGLPTSTCTFYNAI